MLCEEKKNYRCGPPEAVDETGLYCFSSVTDTRWFGEGELGPCLEKSCVERKKMLALACRQPALNKQIS